MLGDKCSTCGEPRVYFSPSFSTCGCDREAVAAARPVERSDAVKPSNGTSLIVALAVDDLTPYFIMDKCKQVFLNGRPGETANWYGWEPKLEQQALAWAQKDSDPHRLFEIGRVHITRVVVSVYPSMVHVPMGIWLPTIREIVW